LSDRASALVIDDEKQIRKLLRIVLEEQQYRVFEAESGRQGIAEVAQRKPDVVLLDLGLPDLDGLEVLKRLREWSRVPILILSVRDGPEEKVAALDAGADDYVTKPFESAELLARLRAIQRRGHATPEEPTFQAGHLTIDFVSRMVMVNGDEVKLTATEYSLLKVLAQHAGKVVTHKQLLREVWGPNAEEQSQYLRVYVTHLRKKIELPHSSEKLLRTEAGIGYRLIAASPKSAPRSALEEKTDHQ
jgi:two-component system KDP operon response regulator KdpE